MLKDILVLLDQRSERAAAFAQVIAADCDAFVTGLCPKPVHTLEGLSYSQLGSDGPSGVQGEVLLSCEAILERFTRSCRQARLHFETVLADGDYILPLSETYDLIVMEQKKPRYVKAADVYLEPLLLFSGRPCLVVPFVDIDPSIFKVVTIAWDSSTSAARAVADAIPLMRRANRVEIVTVSEENTERRESATRLIQHLSRHGIEARHAWVRPMGSVGDALLSCVAEIGSDLLVMGAYDHSRVRERVLGGASKDVLRSMIVPVLMSH